MKIIILVFGIVLLLLISAIPITFSQASFIKTCDQEELGNLFSRKKSEQIKTPLWKIVESNLSQEIKNCILEKVKKIKEIKNIEGKRLLYSRQEYTMISDGVVDAIASNFGYAAVYASTPKGLLEKYRINQKRLIKVSFSVEFDGTVNVHNIFEIMSVNNNIIFFEHFDKQKVDKSKECLLCHRQSTQKLKILGHYKSPFIQTHSQVK